MQNAMPVKATNEEITQIAVDQVNAAVERLVNTLYLYKPNDRSDIDRRFAIALTDAEKLKAYIKEYIAMSARKQDE